MKILVNHGSHVSPELCLPQRLRPRIAKVKFLRAAAKHPGETTMNCRFFRAPGLIWITISAATAGKIARHFLLLYKDGCLSHVFFLAGLNSVFFKVISVVHLFFSALLDATQQYFLMRETRHKNTHSCDIV